MELIKKNILLFSVITITVIISLVLAYFIFIKRNQMNKRIAETNKLKHEIETLNSQRIAPVTGNLELINSDTVKYTEKVKNIQLRFGQPYYQALKSFGAELGLTPEQLREKFKTFCDENVTSTTSYDQIIIKFRRQFKKSKTTTKWEQAWTAFKREVAKATIEKVNDSNAYSILLFVLGLPREVSILKANRFRQEFRDKVKAKLDAAKIYYELDALTFSLDFNKLPDKQDIPLMIHNLTIIGDLIVKRLIPSGISSLDSFKIRRLEPEVIGDYQYFRYSMTVKGSLNNIRKFVDNLAMAYSDSRVYVVRGITINKVEDQAAGILDEAMGVVQPDTDSNKLNGQGSSPRDIEDRMNANGHGRDFTPGGVIKKEAIEAAEHAKKLKLLEEQAQLKLPYYKRKAYGKIIIGKNKLCEAVIDIDYVRYKANDISLN